jgi:hypothetical protein
MKRYPVLIISMFLITAVISSCSSSLKVTSDYDKAVNFSQYKTFLIDTFRLNQSISQLNQVRAVNAVKAELIKKGMSESSSPDALVHISVILKDMQSMTSNTNYYGYGGFYRPYAWGGGMGASGYTTYNVQNYKEGSLIIDIVDSKTKNLIWEGIGNKDLDKAPKNPEETIPQAIAMILENYPPGAADKKK